MSRKTKAAAGIHLGVVLVAAMLAGCASAPAPSLDETSTATLSGPPDTPAIGCNAAALRQSILQRVNQARTSGQMCGDGKQPAVKALVWQPALAAAATKRASEMAQRGTFGSADRAMEQRLRQEGYRPVAAQESAAAGDFTPDMATQAWLSHQQQCTALLNPSYTDVGAGCANAPGTEWGHYFTVVVARPGEGGMPKAPATKAKATAKPKATAANAKPKAKASSRAIKPVPAKKAAGATPCRTAACKQGPAPVR